MNEPYDGYDYFDDGYDQGFEGEQVAEAAAGGAAPAAAASSGLPLRGLAMVLIAVAALFGLWGVYTITQKSEEGGPTAAPQVESEAPPKTAVPAPSTPSEPGAPGEHGVPGASGAPAPEAQPAPGTPTPEAQPAPVAPAARINVLNNSHESGLAERTFKQLRDEGHQMGEHGNLPEQNAKLNQSTVFYNVDDPAGKSAAERLAADISQTYGVPVVAAPNDPGLPSEMTAPGQITLALIGKLSD